MRNLNSVRVLIFILIPIFVLSQVAFFAVVKAQGEPGVGGYEKGSLKVELITMFELTDEIYRDPDRVYIQQTGDGGFIVGGDTYINTGGRSDDDIYLAKYSSGGKWSGARLSVEPLCRSVLERLIIRQKI